MKPYTLTLDPCQRYPNLAGESAIAILGVLFSWSLRDEDDDLQTVFDRYYQFSSGWNEATLNKQSAFTYPSDPDLYPIATVIRGEETCHFYPYSLVAIVQPDGTALYQRMD